MSPVDVRDAGEIERAITGFAARVERRPDRDVGRCGLRAHRALIITLAARHKLPTVYVSALHSARRWSDLLRAGLPRPVSARCRLR